MKKAVMIGAGQYGRGVIAMLLEQAGYHVLLADINRAVIDDIQQRGMYFVRRIDDETSTVCVKNISAMSSASPDFPEKCAECDILCTCAGLTAFPKIAVPIAKSISLRFRAGCEDKINVLACENAIGGSTILKKYVLELLNEEERDYLESHIGFPDCAIDGIIPPAKNDLPADVTAEKYYEWDSLKSGFRGDLPEIKGLNIVEDLTPYLERKLFTLNGPNAVTGSLGYRKGYETVQEALNDQEIYPLVWEMMTEAGQMLSKRHGFSEEEMLKYRTFIMDRFRNPHVPDSCVRVAREPVRKLSPNDRIVAALRHAQEYSLDTPAYFAGIAAVMGYDNPADAQSAEIQTLIGTVGFSAALEKITGIAEGSAESLAVEKEYRALTGRG